MHQPRSGRENATGIQRDVPLVEVRGRLAVSDILSKKLLPQVPPDLGLYTGCIAGASQVGNYEKYLKTAGFESERVFIPRECVRWFYALAN